MFFYIYHRNLGKKLTNRFGEVEIISKNIVYDIRNSSELEL